MNAACVVAFVACVNADKFSVMYLILLKSPMHGPRYMPSVRPVGHILCCMREC